MLKQIHKMQFNQVYYILTLLLAFVAPLSWKTSRLLIILIIFTSLIQFDFKHYFYQIKHSKFLMALLVFLFYQFLTLLWTEASYEDSYGYIRTYLLWFAIPILALKLKKSQITNIITAFLFGMVISEIICYGMYFNFWTVNGHGSDYVSPFMHHTSYSIFMAFTAIILLNRLYSSSYSVKEKIIMGIFFMTVSGNLFISQGRIGQLSFAIAIIIVGILHFKLNFKTIFGSIIVIGVIFFTAYQVSPMFQKRVQMASNDIKKIQEGDLESSWGIRIAFVILGSEIIKDNPFFGVGLEDTQHVKLIYLESDPSMFTQNVRNYMKISYHFHNQYIMTTLQGGMIGLILFFIMFYYLLRLPIEDKELKRLSILFVVVFFVSFISDPLMMYEQTRTLFILFVSIFVTMSIPQVEKGL